MKNPIKRILVLQRRIKRNLIAIQFFIKYKNNRYYTYMSCVPYFVQWNQLDYASSCNNYVKENSDSIIKYSKYILDDVKKMRELYETI